MTPKALLIPLAAFAVTVTGVSAFNSDVLENAGLSNEQISAFEEAKELKMSGDKDAARDVLIEAGVDEDTLKNVHRAMHEYRNEHREAVHDAVEANDFGAFQAVVDEGPLGEIITTESDFAQFVEAHELREAGEREAAREIMEELGFEKPDGHRHGKGGKFHHRFHDGIRGGDRIE